MSLNTFRPVALIPAYNHYQVIDELLDALEALDLPVILVDDGSNDLCARSLDVSAASHRKASLVRLAKNGGKGAAVIAGLYVADNMNFTHAIQIDADGQHDLGSSSPQPAGTCLRLSRLRSDGPLSSSLGSRTHQLLGACQHALEGAQRCHVRLSRLSDCANATRFAFR